MLSPVRPFQQTTAKTVSSAKDFGCSAASWIWFVRDSSPLGAVEVWKRTEGNWACYKEGWGKYSYMEKGIFQSANGWKPQQCPGWGMVFRSFTAKILFPFLGRESLPTSTRHTYSLCLFRLHIIHNPHKNWSCPIILPAAITEESLGKQNAS